MQQGQPGVQQVVVLTHEEMHWAVDHDYRIGRELNDAMRRRRKVGGPVPWPVRLPWFTKRNRSVYIARCLLHVACRMLHVAYCAYCLCSLVRVARCMWSVAPGSCAGAASAGQEREAEERQRRFGRYPSHHGRQSSLQSLTEWHVWMANRSSCGTYGADSVTPQATPQWHC